eukprot:8883822-Pyramimonas_sp.AAC.1
MLVRQAAQRKPFLSGQNRSFIELLAPSGSQRHELDLTSFVSAQVLESVKPWTSDRALSAGVNQLDAAPR